LNMAKTRQRIFLFGTMVLVLTAAAFAGGGTYTAEAMASSAPPWLTRAMRNLTSDQVMQEVVTIRKAYDQAVAQQGQPEEVAEVRNMSVPAGGDHTIPVRLYVPRAPASPTRPLVVYFHGGGFFSGGLDTHDIMVRRLANVSEASVLSVGYRLAPEHPFPSGLEDCYAAVLWAGANADKLGIAANKIATAGDSAGGTLSTGVVQLLRDRGGPKLTMQVLFYPTTAGFADTLTREQFRDKALIDTHYMALVMRSYIAKPEDAWSPLFASLHSNPKSVPTTLVHSARFDTLRDEGEQYAEMLKAAGINAQWVRYAGAPHGFTQMFQQVGTGMAGRLSLDDAAMALKSAFAATLVP
jgi:acetyl esterase